VVVDHLDAADRMPVAATSVRTLPTMLVPWLPVLR